MPDPARWTFLVYLAADNDLSRAAEVDLAEMRRVGSSADVHVVVEIDRSGDAPSARHHVERDGAGEATVDLGETDSGAPETLQAFVEWAIDAYPAERYALVLWSHGSGWAPAEVRRIAAEAGVPDPDREAERSAGALGRGVFFRSSLRTILALPSPEERAICTDDGSGHSLDTLELARVLEAVAGRLGRPLDLLGMDACRMSNLEVCYQLRDHVRVLVGSEADVPGQGWPYHEVLAHLQADPSQSPEALGAFVVDAFLRSHLARGEARALTHAAFDLARLEDVAAPVDALADALAEGMAGGHVQSIWGAQRASANFAGTTLWDLAHFCAALAVATSDEAVVRAAGAVRDALAPGPGRFVLAEGHHGADVAEVGGLSVYLQPRTVDLSPYYAELAFARDRRWHAMLRAYHGDDGA